MGTGENSEKYKSQIKELELQLSEKKFELEELRRLHENGQNQRNFFQLVADFAFGWELWFDPDGKIIYCSPSCYDLSGYTSNQIVASEQISDLLIYSADKEKFDRFISDSLDQMLINQELEFRILTRTRQLRWCQMNIRGVYNKEGRYLGIRASINDITRLKQALEHIHDLSEKKKMDSRTRQWLKSELEIKERELISFLLQLSKKNELMTLITKKLKEASSMNYNAMQQKISNVLETLENSPPAPVDWEMVVAQLEKLYPGFLDRLQLKHPKLTPKEKKLCASLRLGLSSKEIAGLNNITPQSVEIARVRLRKKINLKSGIRLTRYLEQV